ncbi:Hint domain-containing protein [Thalassovita aquimarina]|uniref:Hint domain-containing protein n=1 Tax=Thalassovita aquimarina TaxID=2785917 RepID=UPI003567783A
MNSILPPSRYRASTPYSQDRDQAVISADPVKTALMRRYEVQYLDQDGSVAARSAIAPATAPFEAAFSAFARGTLIQTADGPCAIEDIVPGMRIETKEYGPLPMLWRGMMNIIPNTPTDRPEQAQLTRIMAGTFGLGRPGSDLVLGPAARMPRRGHIEGFVPIRHFADGDSVVQTSPPSPVQVFHLCLPQQATIRANGLPIASYHPRFGLGETMGPQMLKLFLSLFPHVEALNEFGSALHRDASRQVNLLEDVAI